MLTTSKRKGEIGVAAALGGIAGFLILTAARMPLGTTVMPGPGVMPLGIGMGLAATAIALLAAALKRRRDASETVRFGSRDILVAIAGLAWASLLFEALGFFLCLGIFLLALVKEFGRPSWIKSLAFAVLAVGSAYWFFAILLGVSLPLGLLLR
jgi:hypothetical protein